MGNYDAIPKPPGGVGIGGFDAQALKLALVEDPGEISGTIFDDSSSSCTLDQTAGGLTGVQVKLENDDTGAVFQTFTKFGGDYNATVPPGTYSVSMVETPTTSDTCEPARVQEEMLIQGDRKGGNDFSGQKAQCDPNVMMTGIAPSSSNACGYTPYPGCLGKNQITPCGAAPWTYCATVENNGNNWPQNSVNLTMSVPGATYCGIPDSITCTGGSTGNPVTMVPTLGGGGLEFTNPNAFAGGGVCTICITVLYPTTPAGTLPVHCATAELTTNCPFEFDSICADESCSCDPNDMTVWPSGCGSEGRIKSQQLKYRVRFENTGLGTAKNIYIKNPIDSNLDLSTLQIREASHGVTRLQIDNGVMWIFFDEILLASFTPGNEDLNKGYVIYTISPYENLPEGTLIDNIADIHFDENPPVVTNMIRNTLVADPGLTADFSIAEVGNACDFTSLEDGAISTNHSWNFGGESHSNAEDPSGILFEGDDRLVSHFISDGTCSDFVTKDVLSSGSDEGSESTSGDGSSESEDSEDDSSDDDEGSESSGDGSSESEESEDKQIPRLRGSVIFE